jgi:hypothetical protein
MMKTAIVYAALALVGCAGAYRDPVAPARLVNNEAAMVIDRATADLVADTRGEALAAQSLCESDDVACRRLANERVLAAAKPRAEKLTRAVDTQHLFAAAIQTVDACRVAERHQCEATATARVISLLPKLQDLVSAIRGEEPSK